MATPKLDEFLGVWGRVSVFIAPQFQPSLEMKNDYCPYGTNIPVKAAIFNGKYAAFEYLREYDFGADNVVRLEQIKPDEDMAKRWEEKGLNPSTISEAMNGHYLSTAFFLAESIMGDWQDKLRERDMK